MTQGELLSFPETTCDRCGEIVPRNNSSILIEQLAANGVLICRQDRHVFPTTTCLGSPSRRHKIETDLAWAEAYARIKDL